MDHDPDTCTICARHDRMAFDAVRDVHFLPHDGGAAFPLFRLYPMSTRSGEAV